MAHDVACHQPAENDVQLQALGFGAGGTEQEAELRAAYEQDAATAGAEAAAYGAGCACVHALVVAGDLASLAGLRDVDAVRGVEAAPRGAVVSALSIRPLRPSETGTVEQEPS